MSDAAFRGSQPPSKVLHIRNLPHEVTEDELIELCAPFGRIVKTKRNVGANRNQAFVEFPETNQAIKMISYFASSSEPAKVRSKTVYLQYSTRQEIVNSSSSGGDSTGNVLLVTLENLQADTTITIDVLHLVFSAFGFVVKIATFEKSSGYQALVQYGDPETARTAKDMLDGRSIPRHLLPEGATPCSFKIAFSAHTDLNVRFQSHRSRDYTNPYLPYAAGAADSALGIAAPLNSDPTDGNVLLCQVDNMAYPVTVDAIHTVFSTYGFVQKIAIFEKNGQWQALVQYADGVSATNAKSALENHCIYEGGFNKLRLSYSVHRDLNVRANNDKSWDYTQPPASAAPPPAHAYQPPSQPAAAQPTGGDVSVTGIDYERAHEEVARAAHAVMAGHAEHAAPHHHHHHHHAGGMHPVPPMAGQHVQHGYPGPPHNARLPGGFQSFGHQPPPPPPRFASSVPQHVHAAAPQLY